MEIVISTPRICLKSFRDRYDTSTLIVKRIERSTPSRWARDRNRGVKLVTHWTSQKLFGTPYLDTLATQLDKITASASPQKFWDFWSEYLDAERKEVDDAKSHPGWSYSKCRHGLNGAIEFFLDKEQEVEALITENRGRILLEMGDSHSPAMEIRGWSEFGWLSASAVRGSLSLEEVPPTGRLRPDWLGLQALFRRRFDSLQLLKSGNTPLPGLNQILPDGPKDELPEQPFESVLRDDYDLNQRKAISKALTSGTVTVILGPPGTGKTAVIAEVAAQIAKRGDRVLISSQTNLAVDNALERLKPVDDVFAVRIGNPESVKLGKDLLLDYAGERYKKRLVARSQAALADEETAVARLAQRAPGKDELDSITRGAVETVRAANTADKAAADLGAATKGAEKATELWQERRVSTERLFSRIGLNQGDLAAVLQLWDEVIKRGWDPIVLGHKKSQLERAFADREKIVEFIRLAEDYRSAHQRMDRIGEDQYNLERRIQA